MSFICMRGRHHFYVNGFALSLTLKQRLGPGNSGMAYFEYLCLTCHLSFSRWRPMMAYTLPCRKDIPKWSAMVTRQDLFSAYPNSTKMFSWIQAWHQAKRKSNQEALRRGCRSTLSLLCCFNWLRYLQRSNITKLDLYWLNIEIKDHIREIKIHVYDIRQTANVSWEFLRIENKQLKTVQNDSFG